MIREPEAGEADVMEFTVSLYQLGLFFFFVTLFIVVLLIGAAALYLIITLRNFNMLTQRIDMLVDMNEKSITEGIALLPILVQNINDLSLGLKASVMEVETMLGVLGDNLTQIVSSSGSSTGGLAGYAAIASDAFRIVTSLFSKNPVSKAPYKPARKATVRRPFFRKT